MITNTWLIRLTPKQFEALKDGLKSYFRHQINLTIETVTYDLKSISLSVDCPDSMTQNNISIYINGFICAKDIS